jgi:hypothetical protein
MRDLTVAFPETKKIIADFKFVNSEDVDLVKFSAEITEHFSRPATVIGPQQLHGCNFLLL